ncbi:dihydroorotate dehydrogenase (NAD+) catalytic subunit [Spirochaetota bacterium]|nr:dihydroorotate dehydrogenase (NAD+) catalytic subunit [Spirochaetota bacterium]
MIEIDFAGIPFKTPLVGVSGTAGYITDFKPFTDMNAFGGIAFKSITPLKRQGSPPPRVCECEAGFINSIGLQNDGIEAFLTCHYPRAQAIPVQKIVNLAAFSIADFTHLVRKVAELDDIALIELNVSCPNVDYNGRDFASDSGLLRELIVSCTPLKKDKPLMIKLSPHGAVISELALLCEKYGADALSLVNTFRGMKINIDTWQPFIKKIVGGYSGIGIKPISLAMVYEAAQTVSIPILGIGGVTSYEDVIEYMLAGASLVGIGTASLMNPRIPKRILKRFKAYLHNRGIVAADLIGAMKECP